MNISKYYILLIALFAAAALAGCSNAPEESLQAFQDTSRKVTRAEAKRIAKDHITISQEYINCGGGDLIEVEVASGLGQCPACWGLEYEFACPENDEDSTRSNATMTVKINIHNDTVIDALFSEK